jgi:hypothetical protein
MSEKIYVQIDGERVEATGETLAQILADRAEFEAGAYDRAYEQVEQARQHAYQQTADPLFFQYQRGEITEQEWLDAVQAVKDAHPYPEDVTTDETE